MKNGEEQHKLAVKHSLLGLNRNRVATVEETNYKINLPRLFDQDRTLHDKNPLGTTSINRTLTEASNGGLGN